MKRRDFLRSVATAGATAALAGGKAIAALAETGPGSPFWGQRHDPANWGHPYALGPEYTAQPGTPKGKTFAFTIENPACYPGMACTVEVYVPAQYQGERPACVNFSFDGLPAGSPVVFDNLIHAKQIPVAIGIGLVPGTVESARPGVNPRLNRSFEFDSLTDVMADFILDRVLPEVGRRRTPDGHPILLSADPSDRLIGGWSSGGIAAFNVAWRRPDAFRRVNVVSGTFVGMRGGDGLAVLVRKTEPKPLRVFINDGTHDEWWGGPEMGDWWVSNQQVESALRFAGYEVNHVWGEGAHCQQGAAVFPEALRWLWKDWPAPVAPRLPGNFNVQAVVQPGEDWEKLSGESPSPGRSQPFRGYFLPPVVDARSTAASLASDPQGNVFIMNPAEGRVFRVAGGGRIEPFVSVSPGDNALACGPDGRLYVAETARSRVVAFNPSGHGSVVADGVAARGLTVTHRGDLYLIDDRAGPTPSGRVWLAGPGRQMRVVAEGLNGPSGLALTPDALWMLVAQHPGHHAWSYRVETDGRLEYGEPFYWVHAPDAADDSGCGQVGMDREGRAYVATRMGVQMLDRNGRVTAIFPVVPSAASQQLAGLCFGGPDFKTLYVTTGTAVFRRSMSASGSPPWAAPITLPRWGAG